MDNLFIIREKSSGRERSPQEFSSNGNPSGGWLQKTSGGSFENASGSGSSKHKEGRQAKQLNKRARTAMMMAMIRHVGRVEESERYYRKKRNEGEKHHQAIGASSHRMGESSGQSPLLEERRQRHV